ncbi:hypothetical protein N431DRAFT_442549 [Stipitochalara longipes BDJ]|nr:hypothetical protein N431DRAFT_442549 [Stipitochalara longipes BDJ]
MIYKRLQHPLDQGMPATREDVLRPIFENDLRAIASLKEFEVVGKFEWEKDGLEFADETIEWFKDREMQQAHRELEAERAKQLKRTTGTSAIFAEILVISAGHVLRCTPRGKIYLGKMGVGH